jgi:hypothetical protein
MKQLHASVEISSFKENESPIVECISSNFLKNLLKISANFLKIPLAMIVTGHASNEKLLGTK